MKISCRSGILLSLAFVAAGPARAGEDAPAADSEAWPAPQIIIVTAPGDALDLDDAIALGSGRIGRDGLPDLIGALGRDIAGLSLSQAQANPFQNDLVYRGFSASPLQGHAPGLAVYVDGARFNLPFGETVNLDLLPDAAIDSLTLRDASPVYGLNALGGALVLETKTGRSAPGIEASVAGGDHEQGQAHVAAGWSDGAFSAFVAGSARHDGGWRRHSPSTLHNGYADLGWDGADAGLHVKLIAADSDLTGNGAAPVELLAADRSAVFTWPDETRNRYWRVSLHPWIGLGAHSRLEASLSWQTLRQNTLNGDLADIAACDDDDAEGLLCLETADDEEAILTGTDGDAIPAQLDDDAPYGLLNRSQTRSDALGALVQFVDSRPLLGGESRLILGFSRDSGVTRFASSSELGALTPERSVTGLGPVVAQPDGSVAPVGLRVVTGYSGLFLSDSLPLGARLTAEIGLRWNEAIIRLDDRLGTALNGRHVFRRLNPGIEFDFEASEGLSLRVGYAQANRAPTPAELSCADEDAPCSLTNFFVGDPPLRQVVAKSWEAGASGRITRGGWRGNWLLSLYRATNEDDIQFTASATRGRAYFRNVGQTRRQGIEASLDLAHGPWSLRLGYALTDATFRTPLRLNSPDNPAADAAGRIAVKPGDRLPSIPRHRAIFGLDYAGKSFALGADFQAQSGQGFVGDEGHDLADVGGFATVGLHGSLRLAGPVRAFASVTNLFDRNYATFGTFSETDAIDLAEAPGASDPRALSPAAPRRWLVGLRAVF